MAARKKKVWTAPFVSRRPTNECYEEEKNAQALAVAESDFAIFDGRGP